jgi:hypothetical protein
MDTTLTNNRTLANIEAMTEKTKTEQKKKKLINKLKKETKKTEL